MSFVGWKRSPPVLASGDPFTSFPSYNWQLISKPAVLSEFVDRVKKTQLQNQSG
jgi:hypothetical protein